MKKIKTILAILPALLFSCAGDDVEKYIPPTPIAPSEPGEEVVYHKRAKEQFDLINQCYRINSGATEGLYNENYPKKDGDNSASFLWPYDGLVSGAAALHALGQQGVGDSNKPTCANGYATLFLLEYYSVCPQEEKADVLALAKRLYAWTLTNLRDPEDGCYWNDKQADGSINKTKWTYNTGVMISNGVRLYKITGEQTYLDSAIASSEGAYNYFVRPLNGLALAYPDHDPWFTTKLVRAFIDIEPYYKNAGNYIKTFINFLDYAYENARLSNGLFYEDWTGATPKRAEQLLMQDAALESLGMIALYKGETVTEE